MKGRLVTEKNVVKEQGKCNVVKRSEVIEEILTSSTYDGVWGSTQKRWWSGMGFMESSKTSAMRILHHDWGIQIIRLCSCGGEFSHRSIDLLNSFISTAIATTGTKSSIPSKNRSSNMFNSCAEMLAWKNMWKLRWLLKTLRRKPNVHLVGVAQFRTAMPCSTYSGMVTFSGYEKHQFAFSTNCGYIWNRVMNAGNEMVYQHADWWTLWCQKTSYGSQGGVTWREAERARERQRDTFGQEKEKTETSLILNLIINCRPPTAHSVYMYVYVCEWTLPQVEFLHTLCVWLWVSAWIPG